jgi:hypothetical protein
MIPRDENKVAAVDTVLMAQIERVEAMLAQLGTVHDRSFARREKEILQGLESEDSFEQAHKMLGELLVPTQARLKSKARRIPGG